MHDPQYSVHHGVTRRDYSDATMRHWQTVFEKLCDEAIHESPGVFRFPHLRWATGEARNEPVAIISRDGCLPTAAVQALAEYRVGAATIPASWR
jgi:hypothetical protein